MHYQCTFQALSINCAVSRLFCAAASDAISVGTFGQALRGQDAAGLTARLAAYQLFQIM